MEEKIIVNNEPETVVENNEPTPAPQEKLFTQKDVDNILSQRIERERAKIKAELEDAYKAEIEEAKSKAQELEIKTQELEGKIALDNRKNEAKKLGVDDDFIDYVLHSVGDGDLVEFVNNNPKVKAETFTKLQSNENYNGNSVKGLSDAKTDAEYIEIRRKQKGE